MLIQVSVNSFGADVTTAWGLSGRLDGIIWMVTEALGVSITTFSAQNFGARNYERMRKGYHTSLVLSFMLIGGLSAVLLVFSGPLSRLFVDDASISAYTTTILHFIAPFYAIFSIIENASGSIRGAGVSFAAHAAHDFWHRRAEGDLGVCDYAVRSVARASTAGLPCNLAHYRHDVHHLPP